MKRFFLLLPLFLLASGPLLAQPAQERVDTLNARNQIAVKISDDPTTSLERYVTADVAQWQLANKRMKIYFQVHYVSGSGVLLPKFSRREVFKVNNASYVDSVGQNIPPSDSTTTRYGEYAFLFQAVSSGQVPITTLIRQQIKKLDAKGRFD